MPKGQDTQMLKGILQGCMLFLLDRQELYGYAIGEALARHGFQDVPKGTIYPLLMTMEKKGLLQSRMKASPDGPDRKYYRLTVAGRAAKTEFAAQWRSLAQSVTSLVEDDDENG